MSFSPFFQTDAVIGIVKESYTVEERDLSLTVCIESRAELERNVNINISLVDGSAESEFSVFCVPAKIICWIFNNTGDTDYNTAPNTPSVVFTADEAMHCIDITIEVDGAVENSEMFSVMLSTTEERVNLLPALANITIIDNDSKLCNHRGPFVITCVFRCRCHYRVCGRCYDSVC